MANMYLAGLQLLAATTGGIKWDDAGVVVHCCLLGGGYVFDQAHGLYGDLSAEIVCGGYVAGGNPVATRVCTQDTPNSRVVYSAATTVFTTLAAGASPVAAVVYRNDVGVPKTLISYNALVAPPATNGSNYQIVWSATTGVFTVTNT